MLPIELIRSDPGSVNAGLARKGWTEGVASVVELDRQRRVQQAIVDELIEQGRRVAGQMAKREPTQKASADLRAEGRRLRDQVRTARDAAKRIERRLQDALLALPNLPDPSVSDGDTREHDRVLAQHGAEPTFDFTPAPFDVLLAGLRLADFEAGANAAAGGFVCMMNDGARLARALANFMLDAHVRDGGCIEAAPPHLVNADSVAGSGHLGAAPHGMYATDAGLFVSPAAEAGLLGMNRGRTLGRDPLPLTYVAYARCFRRAVGSGGSSTRGLLRLHEFGKVELLSLLPPGPAEAGIEPLRACAERVLRALGLRYRVVELCAGRLSFASANALEFDAWAPASRAWLTVGACRYYGDFQARRLGIKFRPRGGRATLVHTASASAAAVPRTLAAMLETHQRPDGTVAVPAALQPYLGGQSELAPKQGPMP